MTNERMQEMLNAIEANEKASKMLAQLYDMSTNNFGKKTWSIEEIIEVVFEQFCK